MAGCECEDFKKAVELGLIKRWLYKGEYPYWFIGFGELGKYSMQIFRCPFRCGSKLTEEADTKEHFAGKVQDTLNEMAEEIPTEEAGDES